MNKNFKKNLPIMLIVTLAIALCICVVKIHTLEGEVDILRSNLSSEISMIRSEINAIYGNVDDKLHAQDSLLSYVEAEYGEINLENHTIDVTVKLVPKLISEDMKLQISIDGRSTVLSKNENTFSGTIAVDIYNQNEQMLMIIETNASTQTQFLTGVRTEYLWEGRIPSLYYCDISGNGTFTEGKYTLNGTIDINCSPVEDTSDVKFEKFILVTELNGEEINREDISEDVLNYEAYPHGVYWRDEYKMECAAQEGDELAIYVEATDSLGYVHRRLLHIWKEYNGAMADAVDASEYIYDPNGVQIFP